METINEKAKELKVKVLETIEKRLTADIDGAELKSLCECINLVADEKDWYMKSLLDIMQNGNTFGNKPADKLPEITCDSCDENKNKDLS